MINRLKELREAAGLSQNEIGRRLNTTGVTISRYEREPSRINLPTLFALARAMNVPPTALISAGTEGERRYSIALHLRGGDSYMMFDRALISTLGEPDHLAAVEISDDAMEPTLALGGVCIVDTSQTTPDRDGLYLIEANGHEMVRRIFVQIDGTLRVAGDHHMYRDGMVTRPDALKITGRVVWGGRRF